MRLPIPWKKNRLPPFTCTNHLYFTTSNLTRLITMLSSPPPPPSSNSLASTHLQSSPQNHQLISILEQCRTMKELKQIHSQMIRTGLIRSPVERRRLLSFCCTQQSGEMDYARLLFDEMPNPDLFDWNSMIRGYSNRHFPEAAVLVYVEMLARGFVPDDYTFPFLLKAFTRDAAVELGDELHAHALKFGLSSNAHVRNALIRMYSTSGEIDTARELFERSSKRDAVMWNAMISGYNRSKQFVESLKLFEGMMKASVPPTPVTYISVLSACARSKHLEYGARIHGVIKESGMLPNLKIENALIDMYAECGDMDEAWRLFEGMKVQDVISWTAVVAGFADSGEIDRARMLFDQMPERDSISWTAMIDGYVRASRFKEALEIFRVMQVANVRPDEFTMVGVLAACAQLGALGVGEWMRLYMERNKIRIDIFVGNALIDMYSKCGSVERALEIFNMMHRRDKYTWTAIIMGLAVNGREEEALDLFSKMLGTSVRPDEITYIGVLSACTHAGLVDEGREFFSSMITEHGIMPNVAHYGCLVDLLARAGQLEEALETINNMPMKPNSTVWGALLGACRIHRDVEMAELAAEHLLELDPENNAAYVLLSNIYAKCGKWDEVRKVRQMMMDRGIKKTPGCSLIEVNGEVHEFVAGDRSHPGSDRIYSKLEEMGKELKFAGYVPDTSEVFLDVGEEEKENAVYWHSEKLAIAFGLISLQSGVIIRVVKNLRMCFDCHNAVQFVSAVYDREIVVRDRTRFHHFRGGLCSCNDYW
ncbi:putative pentatricopeptide repeat-containing protein At3g15930 [Phoenix dactylifera]|uniref:Pentatricopeptide repeat-containing protein At3g15930 n=1 Tax=Phoenix dactylifera TaxID=42345 RepID=A0A8B7BUA7_PHODC|nr:putative pentatricopeptide repeat-containing protein At3g15930 [Phoenix dactylifera]